jgi:HEAT repeat protein
MKSTLNPSERKRFIGDLTTGSPGERSFAAFVLGGEADSAAIASALMNAMQDQHWAVRDFAAQSLGMLGRTSALPSMEEVIRRVPPAYARGAARGLAELALQGDESIRSRVIEDLLYYRRRARGSTIPHAQALLDLVSRLAS